MLTEAQIEIVDEAGHVEDRVRIVGAGEIALATKDRARLQSTSEDPADVDAIIALRGGSVTVEAKKPRALRVDDEFLPMAQPRFVPQGLNALIAAVRRTLRVRTVEDPTASPMGPGGIVIREEPSELVRQASAAATKGLVKVREHLDRLRARGAIDEQGRLLVPPPEDMNPGSKTDL
jgi:hypothetical protein